MPKKGDPIHLNGIAKEERRERLALNLWDLEKLVHPTVRLLMNLGNNMDLANAIWVDRDRLDETAVAFICPLLQAACIVDVLRSENRRHGERAVRIYLKRAEAWTRLPEVTVLTVLKDGHAELNPLWFPEPIKLEEYKPPVRERLVL